MRISKVFEFMDYECRELRPRRHYSMSDAIEAAARDGEFGMSPVLFVRRRTASYWQAYTMSSGGRVRRLTR